MISQVEGVLYTYRFKEQSRCIFILKVRPSLNMTCKTPITYLVVNENVSIDFKIHIIRNNYKNMICRSCNITIIYVCIFNLKVRPSLNMTCKTPITYLVVNENVSIDFKIHIIRNNYKNMICRSCNITIIYVFSSSRSDRAFLIEKK